MTVPTATVSRVMPRRCKVFGVPPSTAQSSTLPSGLVTFM